MAFLFINRSNPLFPLAYGIKCYDCSGSEDDCAKDKLEADKATKLMTCVAPFDRCMRVWGKTGDKTAVQNSCSTQTLCDTMKKACDDSSEGDCAVGCCETDECNAGSSVTFSAFLMAVCSVLGLALLK